MLQEKERLTEEWKTFEEQRKIFERERRNFTEAAIRLSNEVIWKNKIKKLVWNKIYKTQQILLCVPCLYLCSLEVKKVWWSFRWLASGLTLQRKVFEEDRATWLKHQFLNLTPFADSKKPPMSKSKSAFLICECLLLYVVLAHFTIVLILESSQVR